MEEKVKLIICKGRSGMSSRSGIERLKRLIDPTIDPVLGGKKNENR